MIDFTFVRPVADSDWEGWTAMPRAPATEELQQKVRKKHEDAASSAAADGANTTNASTAASTTSGSWSSPRRIASTSMFAPRSGRAAPTANTDVHNLRWAIAFEDAHPVAEESKKTVFGAKGFKNILMNY